MPCFLCSSKDPSLRCPSCKVIEACCEAHLSSHRYVEKEDIGLVCSPFLVERKPVIGRVLVASRELKVGDVILREKPAVEGPDSKSLPVCLNCLKSVLPVSKESSSDGTFCSKCGFPVCDEKCENGKNHVMECQTLRQCKASSSVEFKGNKSCFPYSAIFPLRILKTKYTDPDSWSRIDLLMDHVEDLEDEIKTLYEKTADFIINSSDEPPYTREEIVRALGIFRTNGVNQGLCQGFGLYPTFSFMSHSCFPNARYQVLADHSMILRATQNVSKGDELTISYLPIYQPTFRRRMKLKNNWMFDCLCERCRDPSEFGSFLAGLNCKECRKGTVLPKDSTDPKGPWTCTDCNFSTSSSSVSNTILVFENNIELFLDEEPSSIEFKIESWKDVLHPNHYLIFLLQRRLLDNIVSRGSLDSRENLERILSLAQNIFKVIDRLEPGMSSTRGRILKQIHKPSLLLAQMDLNEKKISSKEFMLRIRNIIKNMKIAVRSLEDYGLVDSNECFEDKVNETISMLATKMKA